MEKKRKSKTPRRIVRRPARLTPPRRIECRVVEVVIDYAPWRLDRAPFRGRMQLEFSPRFDVDYANITRRRCYLVFV